jgi:hypothetical protein
MPMRRTIGIFLAFLGEFYRRNGPNAREEHLPPSRSVIRH